MVYGDNERPEQQLDDGGKPVGIETDPTQHSNTETGEDADCGVYSEAMAEEGDTALPAEEDGEIDESEL